MLGKISTDVEKKICFESSCLMKLLFCWWKNVYERLRLAPMSSTTSVINAGQLQYRVTNDDAFDLCNHTDLFLIIFTD